MLGGPAIELVKVCEVRDPLGLSPLLIPDLFLSPQFLPLLPHQVLMSIYLDLLLHSLHDPACMRTYLLSLINIRGEHLAMPELIHLELSPEGILLRTEGIYLLLSELAVPAWEELQPA